MSLSIQSKTIKDLHPKIGICRIRVRVLTKWDDVFFTTKEKNGFGLILADEQGSLIHARISVNQQSRFANVIRAHHMYDITGFFVADAGTQYKPVNHKYMIFFGKNTRVRAINNNTEFITLRPYNFVKLNNVSKYSGNEFLFDVYGFVVSCSPLKKISKGGGNKKNKQVNEWSLRELKIKDDSGTTLKVILWEDHALNFETSTIGERSILVMSLCCVYPYRGEICISSRPASHVSLDMDIPEVRKLRVSDIPITVEQVVEDDNVVAAVDWREESKKYVEQIIDEYNDLIKTDPTADIKFYSVCDAYIGGYLDKVGYRACKECFSGVTADMGSTYLCRKCGIVQRTFIAYNVDVELEDETGVLIVTLFASQVADWLGLDIYDLDSMRQNNVDLDLLFSKHLVDRVGTFLLKITKYDNDMSVSVSKYEDRDVIADEVDNVNEVEGHGEEFEINDVTNTVNEECFVPGKSQDALFEESSSTVNFQGDSEVVSERISLKKHKRNTDTEDEVHDDGPVVSENQPRRKSRKFA